MVCVCLFVCMKPQVKQPQRANSLMLRHNIRPLDIQFDDNSIFVRLSLCCWKILVDLGPELISSIEEVNR